MFDLIVSLMASGGYLALGGLMLIENVFPPIPSEVVMPLGGFLAAQGTFTLPLTIVVGTIGSVLGAWFWYWVGAWLGEDRLRAFADRHGRWLTISGADVTAASDWFRERGAWAVLVGRFVPGIRTLISVPAGVAGMPTGRFLIYTTLGSLVWIGALAALGYALESQYARVGAWIDPVSWVVLAVFVAWYLWRLIRQPRR